MLKKIFGSSIFIVTAGEAATRLGTLVSLLILYPAVGGDEMGPLLVFYGCVTVAWLVVDLGMGVYGSRIAATAPADMDRTAAEICLARGCFFTVAGIGLFTYGHLALNYSSAIMIPQLIFLFCKAVSSDWRFRGEERFTDLLKVGVVASSVQVIVVLSAVYFGYASDVAPWLWAIPAVFVLIWSVMKYSHSYGLLLSTPVKRGLGHLKSSWYISASNGLSVMIQNSPIIFLPFFISGQLLGEVALVHRISFSVVFLFQMIGTALFPRMVRDAQTDKPKFKRQVWGSLWRILIISSLITMLLLFFASFDVVHKYYLKFLDNYILWIFSIYVVLRSMRVIVNRMMFAFNDDKVYARIMMFFAVIYVVYLAVVGWYGSSVLFLVLLGYLCFELSVLGFGVRRVCHAR